MTPLTIGKLGAYLKWWLHSAVRRHQVFLDIKHEPYCADCRKFHRK